MTEVNFIRDEKLLKDEFIRGIKDVAVVYAIMSALVFCIGLVLLLANMDKTVSAVFMSLGAVMYVCMLGGTAWYRYAKLKLRLADNVKDSVCIKFGGEIVYAVGEKEKTYAYNEFYRVSAQSGYLFLYLNKYRFVTVPVSSAENAAALENFIKERVRK